LGKASEKKASMEKEDRSISGGKQPSWVCLLKQGSSVQPEAGGREKKGKHGVIGKKTLKNL